MELDGDLAAQEARLRDRRARLAELITRTGTDVDDTVAPDLRELLDALAAPPPETTQTSPSAARERELLALLDTVAEPAERDRVVRAMGYAKERLPFLVMLAGVLAVESAVVGLLVPWWWIQVVDVAALLQVLAIAATLVTHPHVRTPDALLLRDGRRIVLTVPLNAIASARLARKYHADRTVQRDGDELSLVVGNQTDLLLEPSTPVDGIRRVRFRADDPRAALTSVNSRV